MDAKEAADAARNYTSDALPGLDPAQLGLEAVTLDPARREWRVIISFTPPWEQQGQQSANAPRSYKEIIISDADGSVISMTDRASCAPKGAGKIPAQDACTACRSKQPKCESGPAVSWWDSVISLWRIIFVYTGAPAGFASLVNLYIEVRFEGPSSLEWGELLIILAAFVGMLSGFFAEGVWWLRRSRQRCGNKKKKRCTC